MKRLTTLLVTALLGTALAQPLTLNIGGKTVSVPTTTIGGVSYVKTSDLQKALASLGAQGGANQKAALEGCMNEWLFNGIWRMRVTKVELDTTQSTPTHKVTVEIRNGTTETLTPQFNGLDVGGAVSLATKQGNQLMYSWGGLYQAKTYGKLLQGSGFTFTFEFDHDGQKAEQVKADPPTKFLLEVKPKYDTGVKSRFSVPDPSFRVNLTCTK